MSAPPLEPTRSRPQEVSCSVCGRSFEPRLSYQLKSGPGGETVALCSPRCLSEASRRRAESEQARCTVCDAPFSPHFAWQVHGDERFCKPECRQARLESVAAPAEAKRPPRRIVAVLNQKGGTAKTTSAVHIAAAMSELGRRVLLVDLDIQGSVGVCLGLSGPRSSANVILGGQSVAECVVERQGSLQVLLGGKDLVRVEAELAREGAPRGRLAEALEASSGYDLVLIDCGPSLTQLNGAALRAADEVLVPVSCDYLALVGVRQVMSVRDVRSRRGMGVRILGVLPTFYDLRTRISRQVLAVLESYFGERVLPPIRVNTLLREAPADGKTIFEYAPKSRGAEDYRAAARWILDRPVAP